MPFGSAAVVALKYALVGLGICICCLIVYLRLEPSWTRNQADVAEEAQGVSPKSFCFD